MRRVTALCTLSLIVFLLAQSLAYATPNFDTGRDGHRYTSHRTKKSRVAHAQRSRQGRSLRSKSQSLPSDPATLHSFAAQMLKKHRSEVSATKQMSSATPQLESISAASSAEAKPAEQSKIERDMERASSSSASGSGRSVCIAITGVDSRIGVAQRHADANHVLRVWLDNGRIDIFSVPRGTQVDAGFKSAGLNYLANLRSNKGRDAYLRKLADIAGVPRIDYWVEMGFSQAIGLIEMLGFKDKAASTLHVLRTRKAYAVGDYQRCYNQGQFIRQMILNNFNKSTGFLGSIALRGALGLVETNLTLDASKMIIEELEKQHFPASPSSVSVHLRPKFNARLKELNLANTEAITKLNSELNSRLSKNGYLGKGKAPAFDPQKYEKSLLSRILRAERTVDRSPKAAIASLAQVYKQRSWIQIKSDTKRADYMRRICDVLARAYDNTGFAIEADNIRYFAEQQVKGSQDMLGTRDK